MAETPQEVPGALETTLGPLCWIDERRRSVVMRQAGDALGPSQAGEAPRRGSAGGTDRLGAAPG